MTITKSENRERYHAEQKTGNGTMHGFGATRQAAVAECADKMRCPICDYELSCHHCRASKGGQAGSANLTAEQRSARARKAALAGIAKRTQSAPRL